LGAAREHGLIDTLQTAGARVVADNGYQGSGFAVPQYRRPRDPDTGRRRLARSQREVNSAHAHQRGPGERTNTQPKSKVHRRIRCCTHHATTSSKPSWSSSWLTDTR
jgi:hypothetical protein